MFALGDIVWRNRYLVLTVTAVCAIAAVIFALTATPSFRSEVTVTQVHDEGMVGTGGGLTGQLGGLASLVGVNIQGGESSQQAQAVLESRHLIEEFIKRHVPLEKFSAPGKKPPTLWFAVKQFKESVLTIRDDSRKGTITVGIAWTDPTTAAQWANQFVALANDLVRVRALNESSRNVAYLNDQLTRTNVVELRKVLFNLIETETKRLMLANGRIEYAFAVVDPAVAAEVRSSPRRTLIVAVATLVGGLLGVVLAFTVNAFAERRRRAARTV